MPFKVPEREAVVIVNLNQYRKRRQCIEVERRAADNRVRFGQSKQERRGGLCESERAETEMDGNCLDQR